MSHVTLRSAPDAAAVAVPEEYLIRCFSVEEYHELIDQALSPTFPYETF